MQILCPQCSQTLAPAAQPGQTIVVTCPTCQHRFHTTLPTTEQLVGQEANLVDQLSGVPDQFQTDPESLRQSVLGREAIPVTQERVKSPFIVPAIGSLCVLAAVAIATWLFWFRTDDQGRTLAERTSRAMGGQKHQTLFDAFQEYQADLMSMEQSKGNSEEMMQDANNTALGLLQFAMTIGACPDDVHRQFLSQQADWRQNHEHVLSKISKQSPLQYSVTAAAVPTGAHGITDSENWRLLVLFFRHGFAELDPPENDVQQAFFDEISFRFRINGLLARNLADGFQSGDPRTLEVLSDQMVEHAAQIAASGGRLEDLSEAYVAALVTDRLLTTALMQQLTAQGNLTSDFLTSIKYYKQANLAIEAAVGGEPKSLRTAYENTKEAIGKLAEAKQAK